MPLTKARFPWYLFKKIQSTTTLKLILIPKEHFLSKPIMQIEAFGCVKHCFLHSFNLALFKLVTLFLMLIGHFLTCPIPLRFLFFYSNYLTLTELRSSPSYSIISLNSLSFKISRGNCIELLDINCATCYVPYVWHQLCSFVVHN